MRVLVTGAAGLIGRVSVRLLDECGHEVLATDLRPPAADHPLAADLPQLAADPHPLATDLHPATDPGAPRWQRLDVRLGEQVRATLAAFRPDAVVHLAAKHFIPWCERFPAATLKTNVVGSQNVIEGLRQEGVSKLVFASSAAVYGPSTQALRETSALGPDDVYGTSKLMGEQLLELARQRGDGFDTVVLRLFNTIGPGDANPHLIPRLLGELRDGGARVRLGNLRSVRDYVYVEDVARAIVAAVEGELPGLTALNVGSGSGRSVDEVVRALGDLVGRPLQVTSVPAQRRTVDRPMLVADVQRARTLLGWEPEVSFEEGLARTLHAELVPA